MISKVLKLILALLAVTILGLQLCQPVFGTSGGSFEENRAKLLSYMISRQLTGNHFSRKPLDDSLSKSAYSLYLKQLDYQKRFLLTGDVKQLDRYATNIDDEIKEGVLKLANAGAEIMARRVVTAREVAGRLLARNFDFSVDESYETDPEKRQFCTTEAELEERWRQILKYQVISRYLNLLDDQEQRLKENPGGNDAAAKNDSELRQQARDKILRSYEDVFSRIEKETVQDHYDRYFDAVARAFDPHTNYMPPASKENFDINMSGSLEGIGAMLQQEDGYIKIVRIIPGSASFRQGQLQAGDIILEVGQGKDEPVDIADMRLRDAVRLIRGKKGTEVRLTIKKADSSRQIITIIRDVVQVEEVFIKGAVLEGGSNSRRFGYIKIPSFYRDFDDNKNKGTSRNVTDDMRDELVKLTGEGITGLVVDLRNNGGGALDDAVAIAGLFIDTGPVVQIKNSTGKIHLLKDKQSGMEYDGPLVLLVNQLSASASEILAGAIQDYGRGVILGSEHTHGKGTVQSLIDLDQNMSLRNMDKYKPLGALKLTIQKFYRVSGESTQYRGVIPDITLPDRMQYLKTGEKFQDFSLPWDTVASTTYQKSAWGGPPLATLRELSHERVTASQDFSKIAEDAQQSKEKIDNTVQSLHIDALRREFQEARARLQERTSPGNIHGMPKDDDSLARASAEERRDHWLKEVNEDPYVKEAVAVLGDILTNRPSLSASGTP